MKKYFNYALVFVIILTLTLSAFGCSNSNQTTDNMKDKSNKKVENPEPVTIEFWHTYSDTEEKIFNEQVIPLFKKENPYIKVNATRMPTEGLKQQIIAAVAGDASPDVMRMDIVWVPEFAGLDALSTVNDKDGFNSIKNTLFPGPLSTNFYNGKYYGLPLNTNTKVAIYNTDLLKKAGLTKPPKTFDELVQAARTLKSSGDYGIGIGGTSPWSMLPYFWTLGGKITDDNYTKATGYINSDASIAALQKIVDLNKEGLVAPAITGGDPGTWDGIKESYLMIDDGPWFYSILGNDMLKTTTPAVLPAGKGGSTSVVGGEDLVIFSNSKHPKEAWTFMKFMMTEEPQIIMAQTGLIPTNSTAANSERVLSVPFIKPYIDQLKTAMPRTPSPNWGKIKDAINTAFESAVRGDMTPKAALDQAASEIDGLLSK